MKRVCSRAPRCATIEAMIILRKSNERGFADHDGLKSIHLIEQKDELLSRASKAGVIVFDLAPVP